MKLSVISDMQISVTPDFLAEISHLRMKIFGHLSQFSNRDPRRFPVCSLGWVFFARVLLIMTNQKRYQ